MRALGLVSFLAVAVASLAVRADAQAGTAPADSLKRMAIRRLLVVQRTDSLMLTAIEQEFGQESPAPDMPVGFLDSLRARIRRDIHLFVERLVPIYDSLFTTPEIEELARFYQSRIGQRYLAAQPQLLDAIQQLSQRWGMELAGQVMVDLARQPTTRRENAYVTSMKSDLRNLVTAEEAFFADSLNYTVRIGSGGLEFGVTTGNSLPVIRLTDDGWTATIRNAKTATMCAIFIGTTSTPPATKEGEPRCQ